MEHMTSIAQLLCLNVESKIPQAASLSEVEQEIRRQMMEAGRQALATYLQKQRPKYPAETTTCRHCGQEAGYVRLRAAKLHTMLGAVHYERPYYLCGACHHGTFPLDQALGLRANQMSAELERLGGMTGVETSFGKGSQLFAAILNLGNWLTKKANQVITMGHGKEIPLTSIFQRMSSRLGRVTRPA